jgi:hypothetical protein
MDRDEKLMAVLGSRLLQDQKKVGETAEAIRLRQSGEESVLSTIATSVSESLSQVLRWVYWWNSTEALPTGVAGGGDQPGYDVRVVQKGGDFTGWADESG